MSDLSKIDRAGAVAITLTDPAKAAAFVKAVFGNNVTEHPIHFSSFDNDKGGPHRPARLATRDPSEMSAFMKKYDQPGRGTFFAVGTVRDAAKERSKTNTAEISMLHADIDLKDVEDTREDIVRKLKELKDAEGRPFPPSIIVFSGHGIHAYWLLKESLDPQVGDNQAEIELDLHTLCDLVGGDSQVCEIARLMRLPGSHNTKDGGWKHVTVVHPADFDGESVLHRYELEDLREMLLGKSPIILRKRRPRAETVGQIDPYLKHAKENGITPRVNVDARISAMMYMGGKDADDNDTSINGTQISVGASMLERGHAIDEVVELLIPATRVAAGKYGERWNWRAEERKIRRDSERWLNKHPKPAPATKPAPVSTPSETGSNLISLAEARTALAAKPKPTLSNSDANHIKVGTIAIDVIRKDRGDDMLFGEKASWLYSKGLWTMMTSDGWLDIEVEKAIMSLGFPSTMKLRSEARNWIKCRPFLWRNEVPWDCHGKVPTRSGLVDPRTLEVTPMRPEHYATWRVEVEYDPAAKCPHWLRMLEDVFEDRKPEDRAATIAVIQELLGAGLIDRKPRGLSRALIFQGGSNFGKSGLLEVLGGLFGSEFNGTPIEALEGTHGTMPFIKRRPWILHEAFDQRKWHFSSIVKAIVTGEPVSINVKNGPVLTQRIDAPIFWGTNHPPQFKESTKAIVNRLVLIECRREFFEAAPVGTAVEARKRGFDKPSSLVLAEEMPGLLAWALEGLQRALERGYIKQTNDMIAAGEAIRDDSNLVAGFLDECCTYSLETRLSIPDFCVAFAAWWLENKGEDRRVPSNDVIGKAMLAMADAKIAIDRNELKDKHRRYYAGVALNETGLRFHDAGHQMRSLEGKAANTTEPGGHVNQIMTEEWLQKPSVAAMREKQMLTGVRTCF